MADREAIQKGFLLAETASQRTGMDTARKA